MNTNMKGFIDWIKRKWEELLIFLHLKRRRQEEEEKKKQQVMSKPVVVTKFFLGMFLGVIEYAVMRPKKTDIKELVDIEDIKEEIKNLENKLDWLETRLKKERRSDKREAYRKKISHTKELISELQERTKTIERNKEEAKRIKQRLLDIEEQVGKLKTDIEWRRDQIKDIKNPNRLASIQKEMEEKEQKLNSYMDELVQIQTDYDRFASVDLNLTDKEKRYFNELREEKDFADTKDLYKELAVTDHVPEFLPLTQYLEVSLVDQIVYDTKKLVRTTKEVREEAGTAKKEAEKKEQVERERIRKEEEERLQKEVHEVEESEKKIHDHIKKTEHEVELLVKRVDRAKIERKATTHFKGISKMVVNFSKMAVGVLSFSLFKNPGVGLVIGAVLINNSVRGLRNAIRLNKRCVPYYKYTDVTNEILKQKSTLKVSQKLVQDSLKQITLFRDEFENKFEDHIKNLPEFKEILEKVDMVERDLLTKQEMLQKSKKQLKKVEKENEKQKVKTRN